MVEFTADSRHAKAESDDYITTGSVGIPVTINLSDDFDDLDVTICFRSGSSYADIMYQSGDDVCIPSEVLVFPGENLQIGVFATSADGLVAIPTIWASCGVVRLGALPSGINVISPQPSWASEIFRIATDAREIAQSVRDDADNGEFDGEQGVQGIPGPQGPKGDTGDRGLIGPQGPKGDTGDQGPRGEQGLQGVPGEKGNKGDTGERGPQGDVGPRGATGPMGPQGPQGEQGERGPQGERGETGATGPQGPQGETGPQGPQGPKGDTGDPAAAGSITDAMLAPDGIKAQVAQLWGNQLRNSLSGELMQASDAYGAPVLSLGVDGKSAQDGTPTPDAPVPIESVDVVALHVCGNNLLNIANQCKGEYDVSVGRRINLSVAPQYTSLSIADDGTMSISSGSWKYTTFYTDVLPAGTYRLTLDKLTISAGALRASCYALTEDGTVLNKYNDTTQHPTSVTYVRRFSVPARIALCVCIAGSSGVITIGPAHVNLQASTPYEPYVGHTVPLYDGTLRSLPDGTKDTLALTYLRPSTREGWAWYSRTLTALVGETTTAATDGITGTVGVDAMSTTGEIADGPTVLYKLANPITTQLDPIELPVLPAPNATVWADPTTGLQMEYVRDTNIVIASLQAAYADLATS